MPRRHRHNLSHHRLLTTDMGKLVPCGLMEVLPGDSFQHNASVMVRLSPMAAPVMHGMSIRIHHFFVPHRLSWDQEQAEGTFEDFITGGSDGKDTSIVPTIETTGTKNDILDYLGCPTVAGIDVNSMPVRAVNLCFNEWYRDQDLSPLAALNNTDMHLVAWEKDYFTSARPWSQKGEEVTLPLGTQAPVKGIWAAEDNYTPNAGTRYETGGRTEGAGQIEEVDNLRIEEDPNNPGFPGVWADLTQATAATINSLRRASALQRFAEERARWGSRYAEYTRRAFGAVPLDSRLQRPEYLGGGTSRVSVSEVVQTAPEASGREFGVGDLYGHGIGMAKSNRYRAKFSEHGYILSFLSVRPKAMYTNGLERHWLRQYREDYYQRELAHIGQQQVKEQEVYADETNKDNIFGWADRYAEYRYTRSHACAEFRDILDYWHLGRKFESAPALNDTFVTVDPADTKRIFNEQTAHALWCYVDHKVQAQRVVPRNAVARLL